ncbi:sensor histidine kinase [Tsukamurella ocularis]|uniref:sensor histidine kinase n=1 Tax=Tsukamurella ocularis TaxID=1970234 RepID=UPI002169E229|nr:histidine kinase [Tsukamurella ocularis]MCS3781867.1 signal transduction histidine kinase [Tsukamurella ocularis]MCS3788361.1 signal transduction histidine kinase [Tsukamurella ocularis]MCS3852081.1 signal transduction histidine kinase [Tsukamurella ocularis]
MSRTRWTVGVRAAPLVVVPVLLAVSVYPGRFHSSPAYIAGSMLAAALFALGGRAPFAVSLALSVLCGGLLSAEAWGPAGLVPYLAALALAELAASQRPRWQVVTATLVWAACYITGSLLDNEQHTLIRVLAETLSFVGLPVVGGLYMRERFAQAERERRALAEEALQARRDERAALARELHDLMAHHMSAISLRVGVARAVYAGIDPGLDEVLADIHGTATDSLADIRRLLAAMRARDPVQDRTIDDTDAELRRAVERTVDAGFDVRARIDLGEAGPAAIDALTLVRVVQEALTNVMKHAPRGATVTVDVGAADGSWEARVTSPLPAHGQRGHGYGLTGMAERAELAGGTIAAGPDGDRWVVALSVPIRAA